MRIGNRWQASCAPISVNDQTLNWVDELKYLGIYIKSGKKFACSWQSARSSFYKSVNCILGVLGSQPSVQVALALVRASALPCLTYGLSSNFLSVAEKKHFSYVYNSIFVKLFHVKDVSSIEQCQYFCNFWPFQAMYEYSRYTLLCKQLSCQVSPLYNDFDYPDSVEMLEIEVKYSFKRSDSKFALKAKVWKSLEQTLALG